MARKLIIQTNVYFLFKKRILLERILYVNFRKLRTVGVKSADELYKNISAIVREASELRTSHENATRELKEACGLQPVSNIKQVRNPAF